MLLTTLVANILGNSSVRDDSVEICDTDLLLGIVCILMNYDNSTTLFFLIRALVIIASSIVTTIFCRIHNLYDRTYSSSLVLIIFYHDSNLLLDLQFPRPNVVQLQKLSFSIFVITSIEQCLQYVPKSISTVLIIADTPSR
jgi:hypothetical protein